jgi:hypothetical protein
MFDVTQPPFGPQLSKMEVTALPFGFLASDVCWRNGQAICDRRFCAQKRS